MSPVSNYRYTVRFIDWTVYETVVFANGKDEAIAKAQAMYRADGLGGFTFKTAGDEGWDAELVEAQS